MLPLGDGGLTLALLRQLEGEVVEAVELGGWRVDMVEAALRDVGELRNVHRSVGGGGVLDQDGRTVVAVLVDVREEHLRIR